MVRKMRRKKFEKCLFHHRRFSMGDKALKGSEMALRLDLHPGHQLAYFIRESVPGRQGVISPHQIRSRRDR